MSSRSADVSPEVGRPTFLGLWRELSDGGPALGPVILSAVTGVAGLASGIAVTGLVGFAAAAAMWAFIPRRPRLTRLWPRRAEELHGGEPQRGIWRTDPRAHGDTLRRCPQQVYTDLTWSIGFAPYWLAAEIDRRGIGGDRILFATDQPWGDFAISSACTADTARLSAGKHEGRK